MALDFFAGCLGGIAGVFVGHPFDTVKVRLQAQDPKNPRYKSAFDAFRVIIAKESPLGLMKGITSPLYGLAAINAVVFGVQGNVHRCLPDTLTSHFIAGGVAGVAQSVICSPMELAKTRMQVQGQDESHKAFKHGKSKLYKSPMDCLKKIYKTEGLKGVSRGGVLTVMRETPSFAVYFLTYEYLCDWFDEEEPSTPVLLFAGGAAGSACWLVSYPVDVVKTKFQSDLTGRYSGVLDSFKQTYREGGARIFSRGLGVTLVRAFPVNAATFATVEWVFRFADRVKVDDGSVPISTLSPPISTTHPHHFPHSRVLAVNSNFPSHHW